ncbi:MAG: alpha/beta hydrolase [Microbacteriaceae bacterium]
MTTLILRRLGRVALAMLIVVVLIVIGFLVWANMVMQGDRSRALEVWTNDAVTVTSTDRSIVISPSSGGSDTGLVYIPGAKVDPYAYMYKLSGVVEQAGVTIIITKPALNLAFFDTHPLPDYTSEAPDVTTWYVGGHSLGGVRACMLADSPGVDGLILFGSYCANDLSRSGLRVLSIAASNDGLSTPTKIADAVPLVPASADFEVIDGANHAQFGDYGVQPGDGRSTITTEQTRDQITALLVSFLQ